jgi:hypothetical protein
VVTIKAFNDIPGCYDDEIECTITEGTVCHSHLIPISMSVVGCPIVVEKDTVGMTVLKKHEDASLIGKQLLHLGFRYVCVIVCVYVCNSMCICMCMYVIVCVCVCVCM